MKIKNNKILKAFTLAELMVIMSVMTVIIAAIAPVFTSRYTNVAFDSVWNIVPASNMNDIYSDASSRSMMQQVVIGATPIDVEDIRTTYQPYSKLIIRSSNKIGGNKIQKQIQFYYNSASQGYLFAGNTNLLLGGNYNNISFNYSAPKTDNPTLFDPNSDGAAYNTAIGRGALDSVTTGKHNTAFGYNALNMVTTGAENTAIGVKAGSAITTGKGNVIVGYNSYTQSTGDYNTVIGNNSSSRYSVSNYTTAIGNSVNVMGNYNVALGSYSNAGGSYNTAIGYAALRSSNPSTDNYSDFKHNTAVGYKSCSGIGSSAQNTTCIGGSGIDSTNMNSTAQSLFNDEHNRVLIGRGASKYGSAATLEVHSLSTSNSKYPYPGNISGQSILGDSSVIVNGNLIVRGQTYMVGRSPFPTINAESSKNANTISLMGYRLYKESILNHKPLIGVDGSEMTVKLDDGEGNYLHEKMTGREHCICNYSCKSSSDNSGKNSYDWSYFSWHSYNYQLQNNFSKYQYFWGNTDHKCSPDYNELHTYDSIELDQSRGLDLNQGSCCPILTPSGTRRADSISSDLRLKNIGLPFKKSLESLSRIKIYNYYFKSDAEKSPHVGVIAQDLKSIFPDSVSKDAKGYYQIRQEDMFYTAVNSAKALYSNIVDLIAKVNNYSARINSLKNDNKELKAKILLMSKELDTLESK